MNYLKEILAFNELTEIERITPSEQALWHALMRIANSLGWPQSFSVAILTLQSKACLDERTVYRARNRLSQRGILTVTTRGSSKAAVYTLNSIIPMLSIPENDSKASGTLSGDVSGSVSGKVSGDVSDSMSGTLSGTLSGDVSALNKLNKTKQNQDNPPLSPQGEGARFERFWAAYPRKAAKEPARKAFARLKPDEALLARMLEAIACQRQSEQWTRDGGQFIPHASTWLNQRRWEDEKTARPGAGKLVSAQAYQQRAYSAQDYQAGVDWLEIAREEACKQA